MRVELGFRRDDMRLLDIELSDLRVSRCARYSGIKLARTLASVVLPDEVRPEIKIVTHRRHKPTPSLTTQASLSHPRVQNFLLCLV